MGSTGFPQGGIVTAETLFPGIAGLYTRTWWIMLLRGLLAIAFGILAFARPVVTVAAVVLVFGVYALVTGMFSLITALTGWRHRDDRWLLLLEALIGLWAGFITLRTPALTAVALVFFIAVWSLATGVLRIVEAIRLRKEITGEVWLALSGVASGIFAFLVMARPGAGALAMIWIIGAYALILGALEIMLSFKLQAVRDSYRRPGASEPPYRRAA